MTQSSAYKNLRICLRIVKKISKLSEITGISKSTFGLIAKGKGKYPGSFSTQLRLEEWAEKLENNHGLRRGK